MLGAPVACYIYSGRGEGGYTLSNVVCLYYRECLFKLFSTNSRSLAEGIGNVVRNRKREYEDHGEHWDYTCNYHMLFLIPSTVSLLLTVMTVS